MAKPSPQSKAKSKTRPKAAARSTALPAKRDKSATKAAAAVATAAASASRAAATARLNARPHASMPSSPPPAVRSGTPALRISLARARAFWHHRQGLSAPVRGALEDVLVQTGWARTLGGVDVYLAVRARVPGLRRADLDRAVEESRVQVVPAVRGCIYLVPRLHVPLALRIAAELGAKRSERELMVAGVRPGEVAQVAAAVLATLATAPLSTDALRRTLPEGTVRSLGDRGKKAGLSSPLPPALRSLEFEGKIERTLEGGRLDTERYVWRVTVQSPFEGANVPDDPVERNARLAEIFFRQAAPATARDFSSWTLLSQRDARAAIERLPLAPVAVEGLPEDALVSEADLPALREAPPPADTVSFLPFEDNYLVWRGGPALLADPRHHAREVEQWGSSKRSTLGEARHISMRSLLDGDRLAGMWELDPDAGKIVFGTFDPLPPKRRAQVQAQAEYLAAFLREETGHARSFSLDTTDAVRERAALVRKIA